MPEHLVPPRRHLSMRSVGWSDARFVDSGHVDDAVREEEEVREGGRRRTGHSRGMCTHKAWCALSIDSHSTLDDGIN